MCRFFPNCKTKLNLLCHPLRNCDRGRVRCQLFHHWPMSLGGHSYDNVIGHSIKAYSLTRVAETVWEIWHIFREGTLLTTPMRVEQPDQTRELAMCSRQLSAWGLQHDCTSRGSRVKNVYLACMQQYYTLLTSLSIKQKRVVELCVCLVFERIHLRAQSTEHSENFVQNLVVRANKLQQGRLFIRENLEGNQR